MKFKLVESIDGRLVEYKKIEFTDEQISDIIDMYTTQGISTTDIAAKYNTSDPTIGKLLRDNSIQMRQAKPIAKKYPVYLNTISYIGDIINYEELSRTISLDYKPSIKLGDYTLLEIAHITNNLRKKITDKKQLNGIEVLAFYMKLLHAGDREKNIRHIINDISNIDSNQDVHKSNLAQAKLFPLLTIDDKDKIRNTDLVKFYSFEDKAKVWLTRISSRVQGWAEPTSDSGKYLKALALQYYTPTIGDNDYKKVIEKYDIKTIVYSLFDMHGDRIAPTNYKKKISEIPYEAEFNISSLEDLNDSFRLYKKNRDVLYGFLDNKSRIVYIGITQDPYHRGDTYSESDQEKRVIAKALTMKIITKLIIFKSYLPTAYSESSSKLLRQLEIEFAERIFKTYYPENKDKSFEELIEAGTLNIDKPGKNQSRYIVTSIANYAAELAAKNLLSPKEYANHIRSTFGDDVAGYIGNSKYSYLNFYLPRYIESHENSWKYDFLLNHVGRSKYLYPAVTSKDELEDIMSKAKLSADEKRDIRYAWKKIHNKNNQDNIDDLDDNINGDDYK